MSERVAVLDGKVFPDGNAQLSVWDRGLLAGEGLFETMRVYGGEVFALDDHLDRLARGAQAIGITMPASAEQIAEEVRAAVREAGSGDLTARIVLTAGVAGAQAPSRIVLIEPLRIPPAVLYRDGAAAISLRGGGWPFKSTSYLRSVLAGREAQARGAHEAIWVNDGWVSEGASSNVFAVIGDALVTPALDGSILAGITRKHLLSLAPELGLRVEERALRVETLRASDEVFIASSLRELLPIARLDESPIARDSTWPVTRRLHQALRARAGASSALPWV